MPRRRNLRRSSSWLATGELETTSRIASSRWVFIVEFLVPPQKKAKARSAKRKPRSNKYTTNLNKYARKVHPETGSLSGGETGDGSRLERQRLLAAFFLIHRVVGLRQQLGQGLMPEGFRGHEADAQAQCRAATVGRIAARHRVVDALCSEGDSGLVELAGDGELVTADAAHHVGFPEGRFENLCRFHQKIGAGLVAESVV